MRTLERLIIIAILLVISTLVFNSVVGPPSCYSKSRIARITLNNMNQSMTAFALDHQRLPHTLEELAHDNGELMWMGPYIRSKDLVDPWGIPYEYWPVPIINMAFIGTWGKDKSLGGTKHAGDVFEIVYGSERFTPLSQHQ